MNDQRPRHWTAPVRHNLWIKRNRWAWRAHTLVSFAAVPIVVRAIHLSGFATGLCILVILSTSLAVATTHLGRWLFDRKANHANKLNDN